MPAAEASLLLATKVFRVGLLDHLDAGDIGWSKVPLGELHGTLASRALEASGIEVVLGSPVSGLTRLGTGGFTVACSGRNDVFDAVVVATPLRVAAALGAFDKESDLERLGISPIVNVHLVLDRAVTDLPIAACVDSPIQFVFDRTASSGITSGQCLAISLSAADSYIGLGSSELVSTFFEALGALFPLAAKARLIDAVVTRERAATFRAAPLTRALRPQTTTATPGMYLAGAWCDTGWPATMEGAVRAGQQAASQALGLITSTRSGGPRQLEGAGA